MAFRFIHTADWQIGKVFRFADDEAAGVLQRARLEAVSRLGELAEAHGVRHVLAAGDVYDETGLSARSLRQPLERMGAHPEVQWHLLPGNHDPQQANGLWDRIRAGESKRNLYLHTEPRPLLIDTADGGRAAILPAPLEHRRTLDDPTGWMDGCETEADVIRVGLAHGAVRGFSSDETQRANPIEPQRVSSARLDYLALGDWHGQLRVSERCWYSGTPETDRFQTQNGGKALLVEIDRPGSPPRTTPLETGRFGWTSLERRLEDGRGIELLEEELRALSRERRLGDWLVELKLSGTLSLEEAQLLEERIVDGAGAALLVLRVDRSQLYPQPTADDLDRIDPGGVVRAAADELRRLMDEGGGEESELAREALLRLYLEYRKLEAGSSR